MSENVVVEAVEEIVKKSLLSITGSGIKKAFLFVITFKWLWLLIKRTGRRTIRAKDLTITQLIVGLFVRIKWFILGVIGGYLLYYFELFPEFQYWIQSVLDGLG